MFGSRLVYWIAKSSDEIKWESELSGDWELVPIHSESDLSARVRQRPSANQMLFTSIPCAEAVELTGKLLNDGIFLSILSRLAPQESTHFPAALAFCGGGSSRIPRARNSLQSISSSPSIWML